MTLDYLIQDGPLEPDCPYCGEPGGGHPFGHPECHNVEGAGLTLPRSPATTSSEEGQE